MPEVRAICSSSLFSSLRLAAAAPADSVIVGVLGMALKDHPTCLRPSLIGSYLNVRSAAAVFHGKQGELRQRYRESQEDQLSSLQLEICLGRSKRVP